MKRIDITWSNPHLIDQSVTGMISINEGPTITEMKVSRQCMFEIGANHTRLYALIGETHIPEMSEEEKRIIYALGDAYLRGLNKKESICYWHEQ